MQFITVYSVSVPWEVVFTLGDIFRNALVCCNGFHVS